MGRHKAQIDIPTKALDFNSEPNFVVWAQNITSKKKKKKKKTT